MRGGATHSRCLAGGALPGQPRIAAYPACRRWRLWRRRWNRCGATHSRPSRLALRRRWRPSCRRCGRSRCRLARRPKGDALAHAPAHGGRRTARRVRRTRTRRNRRRSGAQRADSPWWASEPLPFATWRGGLLFDGRAALLLLGRGGATHSLLLWPVSRRRLRARRGGATRARRREGAAAPAGAVQPLEAAGFDTLVALRRRAPMRHLPPWSAHAPLPWMNFISLGPKCLQSSHHLIVYAMLYRCYNLPHSSYQRRGCPPAEWAFVASVRRICPRSASEAACSVIPLLTFGLKAPGRLSAAARDAMPGHRPR